MFALALFLGADIVVVAMWSDECNYSKFDNVPVIFVAHSIAPLSVADYQIANFRENKQSLFQSRLDRSTTIMQKTCRFSHIIMNAGYARRQSDL